MTEGCPIMSSYPLGATPERVDYPQAGLKLLRGVAPGARKPSLRASHRVSPAFRAARVQAGRYPSRRSGLALASPPSPGGKG